MDVLINLFVNGISTGMLIFLLASGQTPVNAPHANKPPCAKFKTLIKPKISERPDANKEKDGCVNQFICKWDFNRDAHFFVSIRSFTYFRFNERFKHKKMSIPVEIPFTNKLINTSILFTSDSC
jgi:hypothetical protein